MARSITEIKEGITADFMRSEAVIKAYGFAPGDSFAARFSGVSLESVLFYIFAAAAWVVECLFDEHKQDVEARIDSIMPHRPKWYRDKALSFIKDRALITDTDRYDTTGMSDKEIEDARVVRHAVAVESADASLLTIKVAGESGGVRGRLDDGTQGQLLAYLSEIKDAGVKIDLVNVDPDVFNVAVDIYYNPILLPATVEAACRAAIKKYVENLPFNGEYTNMALVDVLQGVDGVRIAEFKGASTIVGGKTHHIDARYTPRAGYFKLGDISLTTIAHD